MTAIDQRKFQEELGGILDKLIQYAGYHFQTEEKYFEEFGYSEKEEHIAEHNKFKEKVLDIHKKHKDEEMELSFELVDFLEDWLLDHLMTMDRKYVELFKSKGL